MSKNDPRKPESRVRDERNVPLEEIDEVKDRSGEKTRMAEGYSAESRKIDSGSDEDIDNKL